MTKHLSLQMIPLNMGTLCRNTSRESCQRRALHDAEDGHLSTRMLLHRNQGVDTKVGGFICQINVGDRKHEDIRQLLRDRNADEVNRVNRRRRGSQCGDFLRQ